MSELSGLPPALRPAVDAVGSDSVAPLIGTIGGRLAQPTRHGGSGRAVDDVVRSVLEVAAVDASLGWLAAAFNSAVHRVAESAPSIGDDIWSAHPDALIVTCAGGRGNLSLSGRLTGRWDAVVGATLADWLLLSIDDPHDGLPCHALIPRAAAHVEPEALLGGLDWAGVGRVIVSDVGSWAGVAPQHVVGGVHARTAPLDGAATAAAVIGSAAGVWQGHVDQVRVRLTTAQGKDEVTDAAAVQVAWSASDIDAAKLQVITSVQNPYDETDALRAQRQSVARARAAADRLLGNSRHALDASDPVTRRWCDVQAGYRLALGSLMRRPQHPR
ncbi:hypothetical protein ACNUDN_19015 [Mycobacterium sp. smrl_JER01]|uniref:hypothetical protein n=1 Tax=Mycobacterium sp. smrl_JER01 TaxID=3402633 RepID=UPI003ABEF686